MDQSEILFYTISSNNYYHVTKMMLESFIKNCIGDIVVISDAIIENPLENQRIHHINMSHMIEKDFLNQKQQEDAKKIYRLPLFCWLKNQPQKYNNDNKKIIACIDGDILFFENITEFIINKIKESPETFFISSDAKIKHGVNHNAINIGFWFCHKDFYPLESLMRDLNQEMYDAFTTCKNPDKLLSKYTDQIILKKLLLLNNYNKFEILCPKTITIKSKQTQTILCHYFKRKLHRMFIDYNKFIKEPQQTPDHLV